MAKLPGIMLSVTCMGSRKTIASGLPGNTPNTLLITINRWYFADEWPFPAGCSIIDPYVYGISCYYDNQFSPCLPCAAKIGSIKMGVEETDISKRISVFPNPEYLDLSIEWDLPENETAIGNFPQNPFRRMENNYPTEALRERAECGSYAQFRYVFFLLGR